MNGLFVDLPTALDVFLCTRREFERTATDVDGRRDVVLLYFALDERFRPRILYLGMTYV